MKLIESADIRVGIHHKHGPVVSVFQLSDISWAQETYDRTVRRTGTLTRPT